MGPHSVGISTTGAGTNGIETNWEERLNKSTDWGHILQLLTSADGKQIDE